MDSLKVSGETSFASIIGVGERRRDNARNAAEYFDEQEYCGNFAAEMVARDEAAMQAKLQQIPRMTSRGGMEGCLLPN